MEEALLSVIILLFFPLISPQKCGVPIHDGKIVGGQDSKYFNYPWFALLRLKSQREQPVCAGSLITSKHVLTAAHCFTINPNVPLEELFTVALGVYDRCNAQEDTKRVFTVFHVDVHEEYSQEEKFHDIALMTLNSEADFMTICLPPRGVRDVTEPALLIGFGVTKQGSQKLPCHLIEAKVMKYSKRECSKWSLLPPQDKREPTVICAGSLAGGVDSCQGDSGGPMQTQTVSGNYVITGIVSYGYGCGHAGLPGLYTNVGSYIDWIHHKMSDPPIQKHVEISSGTSGTGHKGGKRWQIQTAEAFEPSPSPTPAGHVEETTPHSDGFDFDMIFTQPYYHSMASNFTSGTFKGDVNSNGTVIFPND